MINRLKHLSRTSNNLVSRVLRRSLSSTTSSSPHSSHSTPPSLLHSSPSLLLPKRHLSLSPKLARSQAELDLFRRYPVCRVSTLPNGIRVVTEPSPSSSSSSQTATVGVFIDAGSRYETLETNGVAHFLEHLTFKGTPSRTRYNLEIEIENIGAHLNAYTSREQTVYYAKVLKHNIPNAIDVLSDILQNSLLHPQAIEQERGVILREAEEVAKQAEEVVFDHLHEVAFPNQSLGRTILGTTHNIQTIQQKHVKDYIKRHYTGGRMVVVGVGAVDHDELVTLTDKYFRPTPAVSEFGRYILEAGRFQAGHVRVPKTDDPLVDTASFAIAWEAPQWDHPDAFTMLVLQSTLGAWDLSNVGGENSPSALIRTVASSFLARNLNTFSTSYKDTGLFGVFASTEPDNARELVKVITTELRNVTQSLDEEVVQTVKRTLKTNMLMSMDGTTQMCEEVGRQMLTYGRRMHPAEMIQRIDAVDREAVLDCARQILLKPFAVASYGHLDNMPDYEEIHKMMNQS